MVRSQLLNHAFKYSAVGSLGYVLDFAIFNLMMLFFATGNSLGAPVSSKISATTVAILFTYVANSLWTFKDRQGRGHGIKRFSMYVLVNVIGLGFSLLALVISREVLGLDSLVADNVSANVIGVVAAWVFRFYANRKWVFLEGT